MEAQRLTENSAGTAARFRVLDFRLVAGGVRDYAANMVCAALSCFWRVAWV